MSRSVFPGVPSDLDREKIDNNITVNAELAIIYDLVHATNPDSQYLHIVSHFEPKLQPSMGNGLLQVNAKDALNIHKRLGLGLFYIYDVHYNPFPFDIYHIDNLDHLDDDTKTMFINEACKRIRFKMLRITIFFPTQWAVKRFLRRIHSFQRCYRLYQKRKMKQLLKRIVHSNPGIKPFVPMDVINYHLIPLLVRKDIIIND